MPRDVTVGLRLPLPRVGRSPSVGLPPERDRATGLTDLLPAAMGGRPVHGDVATAGACPCAGCGPARPISTSRWSSAFASARSFAATFRTAIRHFRDGTRVATAAAPPATISWISGAAQRPRLAARLGLQLRALWTAGTDPAARQWRPRRLPGRMVRARWADLVATTLDHEGAGYRLLAIRAMPAQGDDQCVNGSGQDSERSRPALGNSRIPSLVA